MSERESGDLESGMRAADPEDRKWANMAEELQFEALPQTRATAEKWAGTISTLTGVFGIVALIKGREDISELTTRYEVAVGVLLGIALLLTFIAIRCAALAGQGIPKKIYNDPNQLRQHYEQETDNAVNRLWWSRFLVMPATVALALAIGITWYGPVESSSSSHNAIVIREAGTVSCGKLEGGSTGDLALKVKGSNQVNTLDDVAAMSVVEQCP